MIPGTSRQHRGNPISLLSAFQHRLGQLLDEQRHPVGACNDVRNSIGVESGIAGQVPGNRRTGPG